MACEYSDTVAKAFRLRGHDAWSCDLLDTDGDGKHHIKGDVLEHLADGWDMMIAHPPCTYLSVSGIHWNNRGRGWEKTNEALAFVIALMSADIPKIGLENPVGIISTRIMKYHQAIQPYDYGDDASKKTCLWLKGLPLLVADPAKYVSPRIVEYKGKMVKRWANQTDSGQNVLGPSEDRWKLRSKTYQGIANAMAEQWGT